MMLLERLRHGADGDPAGKTRVGRERLHEPKEKSTEQDEGLSD